MKKHKEARLETESQQFVAMIVRCQSESTKEAWEMVKGYGRLSLSRASLFSMLCDFAERIVNNKKGDNNMTNIKRIQELFTRTKRAVCYPGPEDVMVLRKQLKDITQEDLDAQWDYLLRAENAVEVVLGQKDIVEREALTFLNDVIEPLRAVPGSDKWLLRVGHLINKIYTAQAKTLGNPFSDTEPGQGTTGGN